VNNLVGCEYVNREYLEFLGVQIRQLSGYDWAQYIHPEDRDEYVTTYFGAMERRDLFEKEFRFRRHDGEYRWMRSVGRPRLDRDGNLVGYAGLTIDITDRRQAEEVARHLASIVDSSDDAIFSKDLEGNIRSWNTGAERIFGYTADEIMGRPGSLLIPSERTDEEPEILKRIMRGERIEHYETVRRRKDGRDIAISLTVSPMTDANWRVTGASKIARDITERRRAEKSLRASEEQLRALAGQLEGLVHERTQELVASQERLRALATELNLTEQRERRRLATELHDYLAQLLALSKIKLSQAKQQPMAPPLAKALTGIQDVLDQALSYTRSMVAQLSPPELHEFGLPSALKWLAEQMKERNLTVWLDLKPDMAPLPEDQAVLLFQSVRELLINVTKHGRTIHATVSIREAAGMLRIEVVDHGAGFDLAAAKIGAKPGFGLFSIRERMIALGGHFELVSRPGEGTQATLILPLKPRVASVESGTTNEPFPHAGMRNLQPGESTFRPS
jgi:PAS domain S-box-containing protein